MGFTNFPTGDTPISAQVSTAGNQWLYSDLALFHFGELSASSRTEMGVNLASESVSEKMLPQATLPGSATGLNTATLAHSVIADVAIAGLLIHSLRRLLAFVYAPRK